MNNGFDAETRRTPSKAVDSSLRGCRVPGGGVADFEGRGPDRGHMEHTERPFGFPIPSVHSVCSVAEFRGSKAEELNTARRATRREDSMPLVFSMCPVPRW